MALARSMTYGLRRSGINGPKTGVLGPAKKSSAAFFCSGVILSAGISGIRSAGVALAWAGASWTDEGCAVWACISAAPAANVHALTAPVLMNSLRDTAICPPDLPLDGWFLD